MRRYLVTGSNGQLGRALSALLGEEGVIRNREQLDITDTQRVNEWLPVVQPEAVIHVAAYTDALNAHRPVMRDTAWRINANATVSLAAACAQKHIPFLYVSTGDVYGGDPNRKTQLLETDLPYPYNWYGETKLLGELGVLRVSHNTKREFPYWIVRPGRIFSDLESCPSISNAAYPVMAADSSRTPVWGLSDAYHSYTYVWHLAHALIAMMDNRKKVPKGIYHIANGGCSEAEFYASIIRNSKYKPPLQEYTREVAAARLGVPDTQIPKFSVLGCRKFNTLGLTKLPNLFEAVTACFGRKVEKNMALSS